jgi:hypothetical protein
MNNIYRWHLLEAFEKAADKLNLKITSQTGSCLYLELPHDLNNKFYFMLWTPLNKLDDRTDIEYYQKKYDEYSLWSVRLNNLKQNQGDFHLEVGAKWSEDGDYWWFPEINNLQWSGEYDKITSELLVEGIERMLDIDNFEVYKTWALSQMPPDDADVLT